MTGLAGLADLAVGTPIGPLTVTVSEDANRRYWHAAGVDHEALRSGALYPPIAANLTILAFGEVCSTPVLQTGQRLRCHRRADAGTPLRVTGSVVARSEKRGRAYVDVEAVVTAEADPDEPIWTSTATFTPVVGPS